MIDEESFVKLVQGYYDLRNISANEKSAMPQMIAKTYIAITNSGFTTTEIKNALERLARDPRNPRSLYASITQCVEEDRRESRDFGKNASGPPSAPFDSAVADAYVSCLNAAWMAGTSIFGAVRDLVGENSWLTKQWSDIASCGNRKEDYIRAAMHFHSSVLPAYLKSKRPQPITNYMEVLP